jgi:hypothetical protein
VTVVFDSGIWISALQFGGTPAVALEQCVSVDRIGYCAKIQSEILETFERKFRVHPQAVEQRISPFLGEVLWVEMAQSPESVAILMTISFSNVR